MPPRLTTALHHTLPRSTSLKPRSPDPDPFDAYRETLSYLDAFRRGPDDPPDSMEQICLDFGLTPPSQTPPKPKLSRLAKFAP